jgi:hypothetical protein
LPGLKLVLAKAGIKSPSEMMGFFVYNRQKFSCCFYFLGIWLLKKQAQRNCDV